MDESIKLKGYHGTSKENAKLILVQNFNISKGDAEWLGSGVYFFTEGVSLPENNATKWAIVSAWDNIMRCNKYSDYAVLSTEINISEKHFLDLTTKDGMNFFNYLRNSYIEKIAKVGLKLKNLDFKDGHLINHAREKQAMVIDGVKGDFYIKFEKERVYNINFRIPNTTILAVFSPQKSIDIKTISITKTNQIK